MEGNGPFIQHSKYHSCWGLGEELIQDIGTQAIYIVPHEYAGLDTTPVGLHFEAETK